MKKIVPILMLLLSATAFGEPFEFMLVPTLQDPSLDWWYAVPEPFSPKLSRISSVAKGEYFNIVPFFKNVATNSSGNAQITYDIEIRRPDGSVDEAMLSCAGYSGQASPAHLLAARAVLRLCFDPEDPYGEYTINATAYDHVANQTNRQTIKIQQKPFRLETLSEKERESLFFNYATAPDPSRALAAFLQTKHEFLDEKSEPVWSAIWFFKTIFENNDFLIPHLLAAFPDGTEKQKRDIILVLALMGKTERLPPLDGELKIFSLGMTTGRIPDPYAEITTGKQLDMLWAEFFATGRIKPVRQLVTALNLAQHLGTLDRIKAGELDPKDPEVYRTGMLEAVFQSALWSLRGNCERSPLLFHYCVGILESGQLEASTANVLATLLKSIAEEPKK